MNEIQFKETFTKEQKDALWQYFIDHSKIQRNGYYGIMFYIKDENDFYARLLSRFTGDFKRYDKLEKANKNEELFIHVQKKMLKKRQNRWLQITKEGSLLEKVSFFFYKKLSNYLFK